jgi:hypothetical protein
MLGKTEKDHEKPQGSFCPLTDSSHAFPDYKSEMTA